MRSHKGSANWVVRLYYRRAVLFIVCSGNELWYVAMYALHFGGGPFLPAPLDHLRVFEAIGYAGLKSIETAHDPFLPLLAAASDLILRNGKRGRLHFVHYNSSGTKI